MTKMDKSLTPIDLVEEVIADLHKDRDLASLLVPKLLQGCYAFENQLREFAEEEAREESMSAGGSSARSNASRASKREKKTRKEQLMLDQNAMHQKLKMLRQRHKGDGPEVC